MRPYSIAEQDKYCRLLAPSTAQLARATNQNSASRNRLERLVAEMVDDGSTGSPYLPDYRIPAGFTYFGQFVVHDLTDDASDLRDAWRFAPEEIENRQSPFLNMGHLYGRGPWDREDACFYEPDDVRLRIGPEVRSVIA